MSNRCNPQHGSNMVDRYIGSAFDVVYAVHKELGNMPIFLEFVNETAPRIEAQYHYILDLLDTKVDKVEGKDLSSNDFTDDYVDQLGLIRSAAYEDVEAFEPTGSVAAALQEAKNYADTVGQNSIEAANQYTDTTVDAGVVTANTYTDSVDANRKTYIDQTVNTEKVRTDEQIGLAREYTDDKINDLRTYIDALHNSAKLYTDTHLATAKDYSDGILVQAKSYTDTRELALIALIQAQATTIGNLSDSIAALEQALQDAEQAIQSLTVRVTDLEGAVNP